MGNVIARRRKAAVNTFASAGVFDQSPTNAAAKSSAAPA
jgi:uncharacterized membrane protein YjjB (DUF3815 family)